jgi:hypothetical protein
VSAKVTKLVRLKNKFTWLLLLYAKEAQTYLKIKSYKDASKKEQ